LPAELDKEHHASVLLFSGQFLAFFSLQWQHIAAIKMKFGGVMLTL